MAARAAKTAPPVERETDEKGREKAIALALAQIEKKFGKGAVMSLGEDNIEPVEVIPTGALALDLALGVGGVPRGRIIEVYGAEASGKTTLCLHIIAEAQKRGGVAAFIDAEHAFDRFWAKRIGVNLDRLLFSQPDDAEQALEIVETLVRSGAVDVIVIDSVAALAPRAELAGEMGDSHVGLVARLMSQALRKLTAVIAKSKTCVIFINQIREKIGVVFGNPETTPGGRALKFAASVRMEVRRGEPVKVGNEVIGYRTRVRITKNKVAPPYTQAEFDMEFSQGISREGSILDVATDYGIVEKSGAWFSYGEIRLGQGRENAKQFLRDHPEVAEEIEQKVRELVTASLYTDRAEAATGPKPTAVEEDETIHADELEAAIQEEPIVEELDDPAK
ncbi:MAG: DNA recombination/repair protein RecA [Candidatus Poribacteria bacterium]|nr:MAG: DNA recombination/repair protein RecA [Candidatus Poribacteria bacterium]